MISAAAFHDYHYCLASANFSQISAHVTNSGPNKSGENKQCKMAHRERKRELSSSPARVERPLIKRQAMLSADDIVDYSIDHGEQRIDLSYKSLEMVPATLESLKHLIACPPGFTANHLQPLQPSIELILQANRIQTLPAMLFDIKNLTVLSLWGNQLREISPEIRFLTRLQVLGVGRNRLRFLPSEVAQLPRLERLHCRPNPFCEPNSADEIDNLLIQCTKEKRRVNSLMELCARRLLLENDASGMTYRSVHLPSHWQEALLQASRTNRCAQCRQIFAVECYRELLLPTTVCEEPAVPLNYRFCSANCLSSFAIAQKHRRIHC